MAALASVLIAAACADLCAAAPPSEPYAALHGGAFSKSPVPASPDDLVNFVWDDAAIAENALQVWAVAPVRVRAAPATAALGLASLLAPTPFGSGTALVLANATLMVDFGRDRAAWLELDASLPAHVSLLASISEYNVPRPGADIPFSDVGNGVLRLVTNKELYDGLRYAFVSVLFDAACNGSIVCSPLTLTGVRAVAQVLPLNYMASISSSDLVLDRIFYVGAYAVRVNFLPSPPYFGSELYDRGDRAPPFQGDAHVSGSVGLAVFASPPFYAMARRMLNFTNSALIPVHDSNIAIYPLQWALSVSEYFDQTGDVATLRLLAPSIATIVGGCLRDFNSSTSPVSLRWSGWDDRLGSGFADVDATPEARRYYWLMAMRASAAFASACAASQDDSLQPFAANFSAAVSTLAASLRAAGGARWYEAGGFGLHSLAAAINGGWLTPTEQLDVFSLHFNDSARICSFSNFDSGQLLDALTALGRLDFAAAMVRMCWGPQLSSGATCWWEATHNYATMLQNGDMDLLPGAQTSSCHAWGSQATVWLQRHALGVQALEPGFSRFCFSPQLVGLGNTGPFLSHIAGDVPTPRGAIAATAAVAPADGATGLVFQLRLSLRFSPRVLTASIRLPALLPEGSAGFCALDEQACLVAGAAELVQVVTMQGGGLSLADLVVLFDARGRRSLALPDDDSGSADVVATYRRRSAHAVGSTAALPFPYPPFVAPTWPGIFELDSSMQGGAWIGAYGRDGYILFSFDNAGTADRVRLPAYISSVTAAATVVRTQAANAMPVALLQDPGAPGGKRHLGAISSTALYTTWVDIEVAEQQAAPFLTTLYVADTAPAGSPQSMFVVPEDLVSRNQLAPELTVRTYVENAFNATFNAGGAHGLERGLYLRLTYARSCRLRIYCISGCYASASAVFFDPVRQ